MTFEEEPGVSFLKAVVQNQQFVIERQQTHIQRLLGMVVILSVALVVRIWMN